MTYENPLKKIWRSGKASYGGWVSTADPTIAEWMAACGYDEILVDQQHGTVEAAQLSGVFTAIHAGGAIPITRVPAHEAASIGKSLDLGAQAVVIPMVNTAEEAAAAVAASRFPPRGGRSMGPVRAQLIFGSDDIEDLESPAMIMMVETAAGLANCEAIAATSGVDAIYIGPADLSIAIGVPYNRARRTPEQAAAHAAAVERVQKACEAAGIVAGMNCATGEQARGYVKQGFRMVTVTTDADIIPRDGAFQLAAAKGKSGG
jgi:4-hydroxy-2-oxoheptanedioate aldolase